MYRLIKLCLLLICLLGKAEPSGVESRVFKQAFGVSGSIWHKFIYKTSSWKPRNSLECLAMCQAQGSKCIVSAWTKDKKCHMGDPANANTDVLAAQSGTQTILFDLAYLTKVLNEEFLRIGVVLTSNVWTKHVYKTKAMNGLAGPYDCANECKNIEKDNSCQFIVLVDNKCHFGKVSHTSGSSSNDHPNSTVYFMKSELATPTDWPKYTGANGATWSKFIKEKVENLDDLLQCKGLCFFRECDYLVHSGTDCYLGDFGVTSSIIDTQADSKDVYIYDAQLSTPLSGQFRSLASQKYNTFIYKHFSSIKNNHACMAHCLLEPLDDYKCEFFAYYNNWCYLGNFRTSQTVSSSTAQVSAYILKANVASMTSKLFPHPWSVAQNVWTTHKETTVTGVTSEAICQGVAALYHAVPVDYYVYSGTDCHLGDLSKSVGASGDATAQTVRIRTSHTSTWIDSKYAKSFQLDYPKWKRFVTAKVTMPAGAGKDVCGAICDFDSTCDMFAYSGTNCFKGDFARDTSADAALDSGSTMTFYYYETKATEWLKDLYWVHGSLNNYRPFIYQITNGISVDTACATLCEFDTRCDFSTRYNSQCYFGDFSASLSVVTHQHSLTIYHSKSRAYTNIGRLFTERNGNQYIQGDIWNRMISNIDDVGREADCAAKCYLWTHCAFYFFANNKCYRGRYSVTTSHIGTQNNNVKYYTRNDFGIETEMRTIPNSNSNKCSNVGFRKLSNQGDFVRFDTRTDDEHYTKNRRCYWAIWAPGARRIRVRADHTHTHDCDDRVLVRYGTTTGSLHKLTLCGHHNARQWDYVTEFVVLQWETNGDDDDGLGIHGYVQYLD